MVQAITMLQNKSEDDSDDLNKLKQKKTKIITNKNAV